MRRMGTVGLAILAILLTGCTTMAAPQPTVTVTHTVTATPTPDAGSSSAPEPDAVPQPAETVYIEVPAPPAPVEVNDARLDLWLDAVRAIDWRLEQDTDVMIEHARLTCRETKAGVDEATQITNVQTRYKTWNSAEITPDGAQQILDATRTHLCGRAHYE